MAVAVLISIQPKWCGAIASREKTRKKTIEVRKTRPTIQTPFKGYIYCTKTAIMYHHFDEYGNFQCEIIPQKVIGKFVCDKIDVYPYGDLSYPTPAYEGDPSMCECGDGYWITNGELDQTCLTYDELLAYGKGKPLYGWHISDLKIYGQPKKLDEFFYPECTNERHCDNCASCVDLGHEYGYECSTSGYRRVTRAPQSWCYVEELED